MTDYSRMIDSIDELNDPACLRSRMEDNGYLYFHRLVDQDRVLGVKRDIMALLREHSIIEDDGAAEPMWSGGPQPTETEYMAVYDRIARLDSFQQLARSPEIVSVIETICGETVQVWEQQLIRIVYPELDTATVRGIGAHQDGDPALGYQAESFYTTWVALMDIDMSVGGLAVSPESHKRGLLESKGMVTSSAKDANKKSYGLDADALEWATTEYAPGSAVIFASRTVHLGLPNHSDRIRLSGDFRYQRASETAGWLAHTLGPDVRRVAQAIDETLAGRALYVTTRPSPETIIKVRRQMLEEKNSTLERAQELVQEISETE